MVVGRFFSCLPVSCVGWPLQVLLSRGTGFMPYSGLLSALVSVSSTYFLATRFFYISSSLATFSLNEWFIVGAIS